MNKLILILYYLSSFYLLVSCEQKNLHSKSESPDKDLKINDNSYSLLDDIPSFSEDGFVNALIEIPAGTLEKWEFDKSSKRIEFELIDNKPRIIKYIGYPGNYGMIPGTLVSKEKGGDGDPLDIIVLGPPADRGQVLKCKIIGILYLLDNGEQDDKLIAVSQDSPLYEVNDINELNKLYIGISEILQLWFTNYKGPGKMVSKGFGDSKISTNLLQVAIKEYQLNNTGYKNN